MNFDFSDELKQLRDEARRFLTDRCPPSVPRAILDGPEPFDRDLWKAMAEMGWMGAAIPESHGGVGLGRLAVCVLAQELGRAVAPVPFASSVYLATEAIMLFGSEVQKQSYLPRLATGEIIGTFAMAERPGTSDPRKLTTSAGGGAINGVKLAVADGDVADFAVVVAHPGTLHLVDLKGPGVTRETVVTIDPTRSHAKITFTAAPADPLPGATGPDAVRKLLDYAAVPMAFEQVGGAEAALEMANAYAKERFAFGRPIGSFQGIKHKLADMYIQVQLALSNAYYGAWAVHTEAAELPIAAAVARISACEAGWFVTKENIQTHGGMGFTWQMDCHLYYRRAKLLGLALGGANEWKKRLVAELRARNTLLAA